MNRLKTSSFYLLMTITMTFPAPLTFSIEIHCIWLSFTLLMKSSGLKDHMCSTRNSITSNKPICVCMVPLIWLMGWNYSLYLCLKADIKCFPLSEMSTNFWISVVLLTLISWKYIYHIKYHLSSIMYLEEKTDFFCLVLKFMVLLIVIEASIADCTITHNVMEFYLHVCCKVLLSHNILHWIFGTPAQAVLPISFCAPSSKKIASSDDFFPQIWLFLCYTWWMFLFYFRIKSF